MLSITSSISSNTLIELFRVLKPGGTIVVKEPDIKTFAVKVIAIGEKVLGMRSHIISGEKIAGMFETLLQRGAGVPEGLYRLGGGEEVKYKGFLSKL